MRSLFFKIFLWFWLAMAAIAGAVVVVSATARPEPLDPPQRDLISSAMQSQAERAVIIYERRGKAALEKHIQLIQKRSGSRIYLFNPGGREVLGQSTPSTVRDLSRQVLSNTQRQDVMLELAGTDFLAAHAAHGRRGKYAFVGVQQRALLRAASFSTRLFSPRMKLVRLLTILLVTGLVCYGLARYLTSPTVALRHATQQLAAGDLSVRVAPKMGRRRDELADLARDFDAMAERIGSLISTQQRLLSDISHELRSPLARLQLALSLVEREVEKIEPQSSANLQNNLERIARETSRLDSLIGQLLSLTRFESGQARLQKEEIDLLQLARVVTEDADFEARGQSKRVLLQSDDSENYQFLGDSELLRSALENVVRNAIRHTPENSQVTVTIGRAENLITLCVCDQGPGVAEEHLPHLFEPFFRADDARQHDGGVGLGLAITSRAVESHGGKVSARNQSSGGLCIEMQLPASAASGVSSEKTQS
jgi:two-component system sensor histidine kinase CpxA